MISVVYFFTGISIYENTDRRDKDVRVRTNGLRTMYSTVEELLKNAYLVLPYDLLKFLFIEKHHNDCVQYHIYIYCLDK